MKKHILSTLGYILGTFSVQATSHFAVNRDHYASVSFMRPEPIFVLGIRESPNWRNGIRFGMMAGVFIVSYLALAEPAKYQVPSVGKWMVVEGVVGLVQFGIFGLLVGWIHSRFRQSQTVNS